MFVLSMEAKLWAFIYQFNVNACRGMNKLDQADYSAPRSAEELLIASIDSLLIDMGFNALSGLSFPINEVASVEYKRGQLNFSVKYLIMVDRIILNCLCLETKALQSCEVVINDFVQNGNRLGNLDLMKTKIRDLVHKLLTRTEMSGSSGCSDIKNSFPQIPNIYSDPRHPNPPFSIGENDRNPLVGPANPGGGMIFGPDHPGFIQPFRPGRPQNPAFLPP